MPDHETILDEMRRTHLAELGARAIYGQLAALVRDAELKAVLRRLQLEEEDQVQGIAELIRGLGGRPVRRSRRRWLLAGVLALVGAVFGARLALRICCEAEKTASRWYATFQSWFQAQGRMDEARLASRLGVNKHRHAEILQTWIDHAPRRMHGGG